MLLLIDCIMKIKGKFGLEVRDKFMYTRFPFIHSGAFQTKKPVAIQSLKM